MKSLNGYHRTLCSWLSQLGIAYVEEYSVEPYSLDIFIPEINLGVEIDGPSHSPKKDALRDKKILEEYEVKIIRIPVGTKKNYALEMILGPEANELS